MQSRMLKEGPNLLQGPSHRADLLKAVVEVIEKRSPGIAKGN